MMPLRDLLNLPDHVSKGDFVQSLAESVRNPQRTVDTYAVTEELVQSFRSALKVVIGALDKNRSQPVFLHGSFGSGKSHFMAMLHLMLSGVDAPWRKPELHVFDAERERLAGKKLLQLHFHMLGAKSFESTVFQRYVERIKQDHPDAMLPALYRDQELFENALQIRQAMGDPAFFGALNKGKATIAGFGSLGGADAWDAGKVDAAMRSSELALRQKLMTDLTRSLFSAWTGQTDRFVDADEGLAEMSRHAAGLGYHGIVLYLDEIILWLVSQSADLAFVQREINKLVKLKEAADEARDIPIVSFIARQRDLSELFGEGTTGHERTQIEETLAHHMGRFDTIDLSDSNLRAIIPHRVVVPKSEADRQRLKDGFAALWRDGKEALATLQGRDATQADFLQVYPFSPTLIDVLIALSDRLQRDRTAIRILVEMLVDHLPDLVLGEVVPIGDVFDLVASSDDAVDGPSRVPFERARDLYLHTLLPLLQVRNQATTAATCQRKRPGHPARIGCSGCRVMACRGENRLVKTLLLASLVPKAAPFQNLTVKGLVHLNHGTVKAPLPSMAVNLASTALREIARDVHAIRIEEGGDPKVSVSLQSVDLRPILQRADDQDTRQRRRFVLRKLLWEQLGLSGHQETVQHTVEFHHTRRTGQIHFANVRTLKPEELRCPVSAEWHLVIDYPFDDDGYTPHDDEQRVGEARNKLGATATMVWLPTFFSRRVDDDLGVLARLEHILDRENVRNFLAHVPLEEHPRAQVDLESLRSRTRAEIITALKKAYGLLSPTDNDSHVDRNRDVTKHVHALDDSVDARVPRGSLADGVEDLATQLLRARFPRHPQFHAIPTPARLGRLLELMEQLVDATGPVPVADRQQREEYSKVGEPLQLCRVHEQQVEAQTRLLDGIEARRAQDNENAPTLLQVRGWIDPENHMGLQEPVANLVAWVWAGRQRRVPVVGHEPQNWPSNGKPTGAVRFVLPDLPPEAVFAKALDAAEHFGITLRKKALNARSVAELGAQLKKLGATPPSQHARALPDKLRARIAQHGVAGPRLRTAEAAAALVVGLQAGSDQERIEAMAAVDVAGTSLKAVARSVQQAQGVVTALSAPSWALIDTLLAHAHDDRIQTRVSQLQEAWRTLLSDDEILKPFEAGFRVVVEQVAELLKLVAPEKTDFTWQGRRETTVGEAGVAIEALRSELLDHLAGKDPSAPIRIRLVLETPGDKR